MPDFEIEKTYSPNIVAGVDEAGRGPLAGPVVAAAVIFNDYFSFKDLYLIQDSKKLNEKKREYIFKSLTDSEHIHYGVGIASVEEIDQKNILQASLLAMRRSIECLKLKPEILLIDGNQKPFLSENVHCIIKGDDKSISIAAASIIAKVTRDHIMKKFHEEYPHYGWDQNNAYGTKKHLDAILKFGITPYHRKSFKPIKEFV